MEKIYKYKIISKFFSQEFGVYLFEIKTADGSCVRRTAEELSLGKNILKEMDFMDVFNVGFTRGVESILSEKMNFNEAENRYYCPIQKSEG